MVSLVLASFPKIYENRRMDNYIEEYEKKLQSNSRELDRSEREMQTLRVRTENSKHYLTEVRAKNERMQEDIVKKRELIEKRKQEHHSLFKMAFETLIKRIRDYEQECEKNGIKVEKYSHLEATGEEEQAKILQLNKDLADVERSIKDYQGLYKEILKKDVEDL